MVLRTSNNLDIGPAQRSMAAAAELTIEAARARAQGVAGLLGGIAGGIQGIADRKETRRKEGIRESEFSRTLQATKDERAADNARADRQQQILMDQQRATVALHRMSQLPNEMEQARIDQDAERIVKLQSEYDQWKTVASKVMNTEHGHAAVVTYGVVDASTPAPQETDEQVIASIKPSRWNDGKSYCPT